MIIEIPENSLKALVKAIKVDGRRTDPVELEVKEGYVSIRLTRTGEQFVWKAERQQVGRSLV